MTWSLLLKEFKFNMKTRKVSSFIWSALFMIVGAGLACWLIVYMTTAIDDKIVEYSPSSVTNFVSLFLFIFFIVMIIEGTMRARRITFNETDVRILQPITVSNEEIITSKMLYVWIYQFAESLVLNMTLLSAYYANRGGFPQDYMLAFLYPLYISIVTTGIIFMIMPLYQLIWQSLRGHDLIQFGIASVLVIGLCFIYQFFLELFLTALNDSSIGAVFSADFVSGLDFACKFFFPVSYYMDAWLESYNVLANVMFLMVTGLLAPSLGRIISSLTYRPLVKFASRSRSGVKKEGKLTSPFKALLRKEIDILFRNSSETFSYTALLIMMPFLSYVVISAMNNILFDNLKVFAVYYPDLIDGITLALILLFVTCINSSGALGMTREGKSLQTVKFLPVKPYQVLVSKLLVPISLSSLSTIITMIILYATGTCDTAVFWSGMILGIVFIFCINLMGLYLDMLDQSGRNLSFINTILSLLLPILILGMTFILNFTTKFSTLAVFTIDVFVGVFFLLLIILLVALTYNRVFRKMEARQR